MHDRTHQVHCRCRSVDDGDRDTGPDSSRQARQGASAEDQGVTTIGHRLPADVGQAVMQRDLDRARVVPVPVLDDGASR
jgi:hypothetical protein